MTRPDGMTRPREHPSPGGTSRNDRVKQPRAPAARRPGIQRSAGALSTEPRLPQDTHGLATGQCEATMLHIENARVRAHVVSVIEGQQTDGSFFVKPLMRGQGATLLEMRAQAGVATRFHTHAHEALIYLVSGQLRVTIGDETFVLMAGDVCRQPRAVPHRVETLEDSVFVEVKSPPPDLHEVLGLEVAGGDAL